ncbi:GNAT family N-acetyltransferase [Alicyclobacillus dauci]|uniref:GNAT family N-acetyltransferase n=1 Tax=Alicyclobacillus dauci TaxID=1475485 RepID=UPI0038994872
MNEGRSILIFESKDLYIGLVKPIDIDDVVKLYNSNTHFLENHMRSNQVKFRWVVNELESMRNAGFCSCKVVEKDSGKIIGIIDFKVDQETYLSLLMIHRDYKDKGFGTQVYRAFEEYAKSRQSKYIRLDVVVGYSSHVLNFWTSNGFVKFEDTTLNWTGVILPAVTMKKKLSPYCLT